jgi:predicted nucleic acid-binding protein
MPARFFLDSNVLVYALDAREPHKQGVARELTEKALATGQGIISYQVVQECLNVVAAKWKRPLEMRHVKVLKDDVLLPLCEFFPSPDFYSRALELFYAKNLSYFDSLILQAASDSGCDILYSEDLQDGFQYLQVKVVNPFAKISAKG